MDPKLHSLQNIGDVVTNFDSVLESAKQNLISGIISIQLEASRAEITALKRENDEKGVIISTLNVDISKLTEEKILVEASLKSLESQMHVESQLREEIKQQQELIDNLHLKLKVAQLAARSSQDGSITRDLSTSNANYLERDEDNVVNTTTTSNPVHETESTLQENDSTFYEEEKAPQTVSISTLKMGLEGETELEPASRCEEENQEGKSPSNVPLLWADNFMQQEHQQYLNSSSDSKEDGKQQKFNQESPTSQEEEWRDQAGRLSHSPPPFTRWIVKIEATDSQALEYYHPKPPTVRKKHQQPESISESTRFEDQEVEAGEKSEQFSAAGSKQIIHEFQEQRPIKREVLSPPLSFVSSASSFNKENDAETILKSPKSPLELIKSTTLMRENNNIGVDGFPEKPFSPRRTGNEKLDKWFKSPLCPTKSSFEDQYIESGGLNISLMANLIKPVSGSTEDNFSKPSPAFRKRKMRSPSPTSGHTDTETTQRALKVSKESGESPASSSSSMASYRSFGSQSYLNNRTNTLEYPSSSSAAASTESKLFSGDSVLKIPEMYRSNYGFSNNFSLDLCPHSRDFWYDSAHASSTKYLIRFFDDDDNWKTRRLTVKEQVGLGEPIDLHLKFEQIVQLLKKNIKKPGGIRIWLDVRDFNIISHGLSKFFKDFGASVTHFSFGRRLYSFEEVGADYLLEFILKNLPNVEYLAFSDVSMKRLDTDFKLPSGVRNNSLKKLKTLRLVAESFRFGAPFILAILLRAPGLTNIYGIPLHLLEKIEKPLLQKFKDSPESPWLVKGSSESSSGRICMDKVKYVEVVRTLYSQMNQSVDDGGHSYPTDIKMLFLLCPALEELDTRTFFIFDGKTRAWCVLKLNQVLELNARSIKTLKIEPLGRGKKLTFPRLENCQTLHLDMSTKLDGSLWRRFFSPATDFSDLFPNLNTVEISLRGDQKTVKNCWKRQKATELFNANFPADAFGFYGTQKFVPRLNLVTFTPPDLMDKFQNLFPNLTILGLNQSVFVLAQVLPNCYRLWPGLKQLVLDVTLSSDKEGNLDSAFTGIPSDTCKLLGKLEALDIQGTIRKHRNKPAISELKELNLLKIVVMFKGEWLASKLSACFMTPVSALYGFGKEMMPNLKVIIGFDDRLYRDERSGIIKLLKPMQRYVTIDD